MKLRKLTRNSIALALLLSLLFHLVAFVSIDLLMRMGLIDGRSLRSWLKKPSSVQVASASRRDTPSPQQQQQEREAPLLFVDVDPTVSTPEPPKDAKYYSALNSEAANPDVSINSNVPKIDGNQTRIPQTRDVPRERAQPLQPSPPQITKPEDKTPTPQKPETPDLKRETQLARKPEPLDQIKPAAGGKKAGDLATAKPSKVEHANPGDAQETPVQPHIRPRTLAAARQLQEHGGIAGQKMKEEGGVKKYNLDAAFSVRATPFGAYDAAIIAAIQKRWYDLLDETDVSHTRTGKVILTFRLKSDGTVTAFKMEEYDVGEVLALICQRSITDPAPFAAWPSDMRRMVGADYREVRFTFFYN